MKVHILDILISNFSRAEHKQIAEFLSISIFGAKPRHKRLYQLLSKGVQSTQLDMLDHMLHIFEKHEVKAIEVRMIKSELKKLLEKYILIQSMEHDSIQNQINLLRYYRNKDYPKIYNPKSKRIGQSLDTEQKQNYAFYRNRIQYGLESIEYQLSQSRNQQLNIQGVLDDLDIAFFAEKLKQVCVALSHAAIYTRDYDFGALPMLLDQVKENKLYAIPIIGVYYYCYQMLIDDQDKLHFDQFRNILIQHATTFEKDELSSLYRLSINYCIRKLNGGDQQFGEVGLTLYREALEKGYFLQHGFLSRFTYRNVAMIAIRLEQYDWAESFSEEFSPTLKAVYRDGAYLFNIALIRYHKKEYDTAMDALIQIRIKDPLINLAIKTLQLKIYYALEEWDVLSSHLDAMTVYIHRNKVLGYHKQNYLNVVKYGKKLIKLSYASQLKKDKAIANIKAEKYLTERKWMLEQLAG